MPNKKRVALISSRVEPRQHIPINLLILAGCIEDKADVLVFDPDFDDKELKEIKDFQPDIIGTTSFAQNYYRALEINNILRKEFQNKAMFIYGGIYATVKPEETFNEMGLDALFVGEGERSIIDLVDDKPLEEISGCYTGGSEIPKPPELIQDLDSVPFPAYHLFPDFEKYLIPPGTIRGLWQERGTVALMSGRGCPFTCIFCGSHIMFGHNARRRSSKNMVGEIKLLKENYGVQSFYFVDDIFTLKPQWVREFCEEIEPEKITWGCQIHTSTVKDPIIKAMKRSGCSQVDLGVESGSDQVLATLQKKEDRELITKAFDILRKNKMRRMASFVIGSPGETRKDIEDTKDLLRKIRPDFAAFFYMVPYPGTQFYKLSEENNWFINGPPMGKDYFGLGIQDNPITQINFTPEELREIRGELFDLVKWWNIRGFLTYQTIRGLISIASIQGLKVFFRKFHETRNLYDAMFMFIQDYRFRTGRKILPVYPNS